MLSTTISAPWCFFAIGLLSYGRSAANSLGNQTNILDAGPLQLVEHGHIRRAYLGVRMDHRFRNDTAHRLGLSHAKGVRVTGITANSPADKAQIHINDVILSYDGLPIEDDNHLSNLVSFSPVGKKVKLLVIRDRKPIKIELQLGERQNFEAGQ